LPLTDVTAAARGGRSGPAAADRAAGLLMDRHTPPVLLPSPSRLEAAHKFGHSIQFRGMRWVCLLPPNRRRPPLTPPPRDRASHTRWVGIVLSFCLPAILAAGAKSRQGAVSCLWAGQPTVCALRMRPAPLPPGWRATGPWVWVERRPEDTGEALTQCHTMLEEVRACLGPAETKANEGEYRQRCPRGQTGEYGGDR